MSDKPKVSSQSQKELDKVDAQFQQFNEQVNNLTSDSMNAAPTETTEPQTKLSSREIAKKDVIHLKPRSSISSREPFNEKFREDYNFAKEYVTFIAENLECIGQTIDVWTKPFPGMPAQWWEVPVNRVVSAPRYVAERIKGCNYHVLSMVERPSSTDQYGNTMVGTMIASSKKQRLDAQPADSTRKSIFMGASGF
jgi:hypothetical protein